MTGQINRSISVLMHRALAMERVQQRMRVLDEIRADRIEIEPLDIQRHDRPPSAQYRPNPQALNKKSPAMVTAEFSILVAQAWVRPIFCL